MALGNKKARTSTLNVLLIRRDLKTDEQILGDLEPLECVDLELPDGSPDRLVKARLYFERRPFQPPKWASYFGELLKGVNLPGVASAPAVLLVPVDDRMFAVVFSRGSSLIEPGARDPTFGLRTALNSINPKKVRSYDKRSFDALFRQTREQAAKETSLDNFGIDAERDLVRTVAGKPTEPTLGSRMTGSASLQVSTKTPPHKIVHFLRRLYRKSTLATFEEDYPWLGRIEEILDGELQTALDSYLDDRLKRESDGVWLAVPEILDWSGVEGFRFVLPNRSRRIFPVPSFENLLKAVDESSDINVDFFKRQKVEMLDVERRRLNQWKLYDCLNVDLVIGAEAYVLSLGSWYRIDSDLLTAVDREISTVERSLLQLPEYDVIDKGEGGYNQRVASVEPGRFCCLDGIDIMFGGGKSRFELCDLLESSGDLIHVKRYGGSSVLSHLFAQGLISTELLMKRPSFREAADKLVESKAFNLPAGKKFVRKGARKVTYAIVGGPANSATRELPLFSRVNLRNAIRGIRAFDWDVEILYVPETIQYQRQQKIKGKK